jgi:hypothetical protein
VDLSLVSFGIVVCAEVRVHASWDVVEVFHEGLASTFVSNW